MRKLLLPGLMLMLSLWANAQTDSARYYPSSYLRAIDTTTRDTMINGFAGGLVNPMFNEIDLDGDGLKDLMVFDRGDNSVLTFRAVKKGDTRYIYDPQYQFYFPQIVTWAFMYDYDKDGRPDLFVNAANLGNGTGLAAYRNTSDTSKGNRHISFKLLTKTMLYSPKNGITDMPMAFIELPDFVDVDRDGDMDILTFAGEGNSARYYQNRSQEMGYGNDSLKFWLVDQCFGKFQEYDPGTGSLVQLGYQCSNWNVHQKRHSGSTILTLDVDEDGDMDMLMGDAGYPDIIYLENGRIWAGHSNWVRDTMISFTKNFPPTDKLQLSNLPKFFQVDIDHDGRKDLVASPMEQLSQTDHMVWYYQNQLSGGKSNYVLKSKDLLTADMLDGGNNSKAAFFDYNGDGRLDFVLASDWVSPTGKNVTRLDLYVDQATGTARPAFKLSVPNFLGFATRPNNSWLAPCVVDMNKDGRPDLIIGNSAGQIMYYRNNGGTPISFTLVTDTLTYNKSGVPTTIDVGNNSLPAAADLDGDGNMDLLVGSSGNTLHYFSNKTGKTPPVFDADIDRFGNIYEGFGFISPSIADLNKDGKPDLVTGTGTGQLSIYLNAARGISSTLLPEQKPFFNYGATTDSFSNTFFGRLTSPVVVSLDKDTLPDIVVGNQRGGLIFLGSIKMPYSPPPLSVRKRVGNEIAVEIYPNPAKNKIQISIGGLEGVYILKAELRDITGHNIAEQIFYNVGANAAFGWNLPPVREGVYILSLSSGNGVIANRKIIIER